MLKDIVNYAGKTYTREKDTAIALDAYTLFAVLLSNEVTPRGITDALTIAGIRK